MPGLAVLLEVAEDERTNPNGLLSWMDGREEAADSRLRIHIGAAAESWQAHETGVGGKEPARNRPRQGRICSAHGESGVSTSAGRGKSLALYAYR